MRTIVSAAMIIVVALCLAADSKSDAAPFRHPKAVQAWNRYQFRENKAKEAYEREVAAAKAEYVAGLREAASMAAKAGDAGDIKAISEAMEGEPTTPKAEVTIVGRWLFRGENFLTGEFWPNGQCAFTTWGKDRGSWKMLPDGTVQMVEPSSKVIQIKLTTDGGHALVLYPDRNPAWMAKGQ